MYNAKFEPPKRRFRCPITGTHLTLPHMHPSERVRSDVRQEKGEYFRGEDSGTYAMHKAMENKNRSPGEVSNTLNFELPPVAFHGHAQNTLHKALACIPSKGLDAICAICKLGTELRHPRMTYSKSHAFTSVVNYVLLDCEHMFHEECLVAWLLQDDQTLQVPEIANCSVCQEVRTFVKKTCWSAKQLEAAMNKVDRIGPDGKLYESGKFLVS